MRAKTSVLPSRSTSEVEDLGLVALVDDEHAVLDRARVLVLAGDLVDGRVDEELVDERRDLTVERGREQQLLAARPP